MARCPGASPRIAAVCLCAAFSAPLHAAPATAAAPAAQPSKATAPSSPAAAAQPAAPAAPKSDGEEAKALYTEGQSEFELGHFREALALFERAYKKKNVARILFNIAQCHRKLGELQEAKVTYDSFLHKAPDDPVAKLAKENLSEIERALQARRDAESHQPTSLVRPEGEPTAPPEVKTASTAPVGAAAEAPRPAPAEAIAQRPPPAPRSHTLAYVAGGTTLAALAAGTLFGLKASSTVSDLNNTPHSKSELTSLQDSAKSSATRANVLFIASGLLAVGAFLAW